MADNEESKEPTSSRNEWEVVSLTASAYAASPGPKSVELSNDDVIEKTFEENYNTEISNLMFMSGHFVVPPNQYENFSFEGNIETQKEHKGEDLVSDLSFDSGNNSDKKGEKVWDNNAGFESSTVNFSSLHYETAFGDSTDEIKTEYFEMIESSEDITESEKSIKDVPCEVWWKRRASSLYAHAKEANAFWSIFIAAAVMGIVILGQRWKQERKQELQLKWQFTVGDQNTGKIMVPIFRLKDMIVGGHRRSSFIRASAASGEL